VGELDWRAGGPADSPALEACLAQADAVRELLAARGALALYLSAPVPPIFADPAHDAALARLLAARALESGAALLPPDDFSLASYLDSGFPLEGRASARVGRLILDAAERQRPEPAKVLVTDLDNVVWQGVVAEDGLAGIAYGPEGRGFRSFLYQRLLKRLAGQGVLLAAVSRNALEDARRPLREAEMVLAEGDFVAVVASYEAKSAQIESLAAALNLGLEAFVFVDDNPVELAEVERKLPAVRRLLFPAGEAALPAFLHELSRQFAAAATAEDRARTELYRRRLAGVAPRAAAGADLTDFLRSLAMRLTLHDRSAGDRTRAVQLINKTNQFNLNGRRWDDAEVGAVLAAGGRLFTATLEDRAGSHGEVLACLMDAAGTVESLVMSCRVFQRRAEHAFLLALPEARHFRYAATDRNEPLQRFLADPAFAARGDLVAFDRAAFAAAHGAVNELFTVTSPGGHG
jgi:FkbH-like protein